jgi:uncharacterized protein (TIGR03435 family)
VIRSLDPRLRSNRYDIDAKMPAGATAGEFRTMLRNLVAERFHITVHHETRDLPGYDFTLAKGGSKLVASPASELGTGDPTGPLGSTARPANTGNCSAPVIWSFLIRAPGGPPTMGSAESKPSRTSRSC